MGELLNMTGPELVLAALVTLLCVGGLLLPSAGNMIGQLFLGQDPAVLRWRKRLAEVRARRREQRLATKAAKRERKRKRREAALIRKATRRVSSSARVQTTPDPRG